MTHEIAGFSHLPDDKILNRELREGARKTREEPALKRFPCRIPSQLSRQPPFAPFAHLALFAFEATQSLEISPYGTLLAKFPI